MESLGRDIGQDRRRESAEPRGGELESIVDSWQPPHASSVHWWQVAGPSNCHPPRLRRQQK